MKKPSLYIMRNRAARAGRHGRTPAMRSVNAIRFREARFLCGLNQQAAADLLKVSERTIQNWESGSVRVPYAAYKLMRILRGGQLPGAAWRGWAIKGDTLWSPEGRSFKATDLAWWSLTVAKADAWDRCVQRNLGLPRKYTSWAWPSASQAPTTGEKSVVELLAPVVASEHVATVRNAGIFSCSTQIEGHTRDFSPAGPVESPLRGRQVPKGPTSNTGQKCPHPLRSFAAPSVEAAL